MAGFEPGRVFAGHRIVRRIAKGGMGVVYEAVDESLRRNVALKVITSDDAEDPRFRQRFVREARLLAEFDHPHLLPVFHAGEDEGLPYLTMRLIEGGSLRGLLDRERRLLPGHALRVLSQVAEALDALHRRDVVHLDVKPENILLEGPDGDERAWLADLGLARSVHADPAVRSAELAGTVDYMAPEQWRDGGQVGQAADVYAFGLVLYESLTGNPLGVADRSPIRLACSPSLRVVFEEALAREPGDRPPSASAVLDRARAALKAGSGDPVPVEGGSIAGEALLSGPPSRITAVAPTQHTGLSSWRRWPVIGIPVLVCALAGGAWALWPEGSSRTAHAPLAASPTSSRTLMVCAQHLTVRRDPSPDTRTRVLATLAPGDAFVVEATKGRGWVYGHSTGSATVTGWALHQWLRTRCR